MVLANPTYKQDYLLATFKSTSKKHSSVFSWVGLAGTQRSLYSRSTPCIHAALPVSTQHSYC